MHAFVQTTEMARVDALEINRGFLVKPLTNQYMITYAKMMIAHSTAKVFDLLHVSVNL